MHQNHSPSFATRPTKKEPNENRHRSGGEHPLFAHAEGSFEYNGGDKKNQTNPGSIPSIHELCIVWPLIDENQTWRHLPAGSL